MAVVQPRWIADHAAQAKSALLAVHAKHVNLPKSRTLISPLAKAARRVLPQQSINRCVRRALGTIIRYTDKLASSVLHR